jgi:hypothetical protein
MLDVGVVINQYHVVEHIGRGGMADVWSARDGRLNRLVAIKTIQAALSGDTDPISLFEQEAKTIAQLEHPHILPIYDFGEYNGQLYIVMRFVTGGSLEGSVDQGPLPFDEVLRVAEAVASALDYAHSRNVVHLDLKPPNILMDSQRAPYLADFGLAAVLGPEGRAANPGSGTLLYMAPEQMTETVIDKRADIFSFGVMMFHLLTGKLPFDAQVPLALKQIQYGQEIPNIENVNPLVPPQVNDILRRATSVHPELRHPSLGEIVGELRTVLQPVGGGSTALQLNDVEQIALPDSADAVLLEAADIYSRARTVWARGTGRFLLGISHYMLISSYYTQAEKHGLELDNAGKQMLLRGALEYDYDLEFWWSQLEDDDRRWVCLHAVRSENLPSRVRAIYRLETLPDSEPPQIPKLIAQALQVETNESGKIAALQVFGTRAKIMASRKSIEIKSEFRGRLLTSITRLGVQTSAFSEWREAVYSPEIDQLIAQTALDSAMPNAAALAARVVGRMRSLSAVRHLADAQREGTEGALAALALVRDEAPYLPTVVNPISRLYAWLANTWRRLSDNPLQLFTRWGFATLGGFLLMFFWVFSTFRTEQLFTAQRFGNAIAMGLVFGAISGIMIMVADEFSQRLRGFWGWHLRLLFSGTLGWALGLAAWSLHVLFYNQERPIWEMMRVGGFGLALGFILTPLLRLRGWAAFLLTALATYIPLYTTLRASSFQINLPIPLAFTLYTLFVALMAVEVLLRVRDIKAEATTRKALFALGSGALFGALMMFLYLWIFQDAFNQRRMEYDVWLTAYALPHALPILLVGLGTGLTFVALAFIKRLQETGLWLGSAAGLVLSATALYATPLYNSLYAGLYAGERRPGPSFAWGQLLEAPLFKNDGNYVLFFETPQQLIGVGLGMALLIALGGHALRLFADVRAWVGLAETKQERKTVRSTLLIGAMMMSFVSLIAAIGGFGMFHVGSLQQTTTTACDPAVADCPATPPFEVGDLVFISFSALDNARAGVGQNNVATVASMGGIGLGVGLLSLVYVVWSGATFVAAWGAWQWRRWGEYGLITSMAFFAAQNLYFFVHDLQLGTLTLRYPLFIIVGYGGILWAIRVLGTGAVTRRKRLRADALPSTAAALASLEVMDKKQLNTMLLQPTDMRTEIGIAPLVTETIAQDSAISAATPRAQDDPQAIRTAPYNYATDVDAAAQLTAQEREQRPKMNMPDLPTLRPDQVGTPSPVSPEEVSAYKISWGIKPTGVSQTPNTEAAPPNIADLKTAAAPTPPPASKAGSGAYKIDWNVKETGGAAQTANTEPLRPSQTANTEPIPPNIVQSDGATQRERPVIPPQDTSKAPPSTSSGSGYQIKWDVKKTDKDDEKDE